MEIKLSCSGLRSLGIRALATRLEVPSVRPIFEFTNRITSASVVDGWKLLIVLDALVVGKLAIGVGFGYFVFVRLLVIGVVSVMSMKSLSNR